MLLADLSASRSQLAIDNLRLHSSLMDGDATGINVRNFDEPIPGFQTADGQQTDSRGSFLHDP